MRRPHAACPMLAWLALLACSACESAAINRPDGAPSDAGPGDAAPPDGPEPLDGSSDADAGADAAGPHPSPSAPAAPRPPDAPRADWMDLEAADLAAVGPTVTPPAAPVLEPCPPGWSAASVPAGDPTTCEPFAPSAWSPCPAGQARFPGTPACAPLGDDCPADGWPAGLPGTGVLYVDSAASAGGTGSRAAPFRTIGSALAAAAPGTLVALAAGTYAESVSADRPGVTLRGACAADTTISPSATQPAVRVTADAVVLVDLSMAGGRRGVEVAAGDGTVTLAGIDVRGSGLSGVQVESGALEADRLRIRSTGTDGLQLSGGTVNVRQLEVSAAANAPDRAGIRVEGPTVVARVEDAVLRDLANDGVLSDAGSLALERVIVERATSTGLYVPGGTVTGDHVIVRDTRATGTSRGYGATVGDGGELTLDHALLERNFDNGVWSAGVGTVLTLRDAVVRDTARITASGPATEGVQCFDASRCVLERIALLRNDDDALVAKHPGTVMTARDVTIVANGTWPAQGVSVHDGAIATIERVLVEGVGGPGLRLLQNASFAIDHLRVRDNVASTGGSAGVVVQGAAGRLGSGWLERIAGPGIWVRDLDVTGTTQQGSIELSDVRVADTGTTPTEAGSGLQVENGGRVTGTRVLVSAATASLVAVRGGASVLDVDDLAAVGGSGAPAVEVADGGTFDAVRAVLRTDGAAAIRATARGSSIVLRDVAIRGGGAESAGLEVADAALEAYRTLVEWRDGPAVRCAGTGAQATIEDLTVRALAGGAMGPGVWLLRGAEGTLDRLDVTGATGVAVVADGSRTRLETNDTRIVDPAADAAGAALGLVALDGATLTGAVVATQGAIGLGAGAFGVGSTLDLSELRVDAVSATRTGTGVGAGSFSGGQVTLDTFVVSGAEECGLEVDVGSSLEATAGLVSSGAVGLCVLDPAFDVDALHRGVLLRDVALELDRSARATPTPPALVAP